MGGVKTDVTFSVYALVHNFASASKLQEPKFRQISHAKISHKKFISVISQIKRREALARTKKWRLLLAYFFKLVKDIKGVLYLRVRLVLLEGALVTKRRKAVF